jgi:hypothetical protein
MFNIDVIECRLSDIRSNTCVKYTLGEATINYRSDGGLWTTRKAEAKRDNVLTQLGNTKTEGHTRACHC